MPLPPISPTTLAHLRRSAEAPDAYVVSVAARDLLTLLDAYEGAPERNSPLRIGVEENEVELGLPIEIKPTVADEYPAVLRQMLRNQSRYLFVGSYEGEGATKDQFVRIFAASGKTVVFKADVDAAQSGLAEK
jgi:hypothetical protein